MLKRSIVYVFKVMETLFFYLPHLAYKDRTYSASTTPKILLIRLDGIGDILMTLPVLSDIKTKYSHCRITFLTNTSGKEILKHISYVDEIITCDGAWFNKNLILNDRLTGLFKIISAVFYLRRKRFDLAIDFRGDFRNIFFFCFLAGAKYRISYDRTGGKYLLTHIGKYIKNIHEIDKNYQLLKLIGFKRKNKNIPLLSVKENAIYMDKILRELNLNQNKLVIGIHTISKRANNWREDKYSELINKIKEKYNFCIILTGAKNDRNWVKQIKKKVVDKVFDFSGRTTILQLLELIKKLDLFICPDTAVMHLLPYTDTKAVVLFGATDPKRFGYKLENIINLAGNNCKINYLHENCKFSKNGFSRCMNNIKVDDVLNEIHKLLPKKNLS